MEFKKASRDANLLVSGVWRLATVKEVKSNLEKIKNQGILERWSILRLLDGWVTGCGYNYEIEQSYKSITTMGQMLLLKTTASRPSDGSFNPAMYEGVELSAQGRQAALLLTVDDKTTEVVHFVLYLFANGAARLAELDKLVLKIKKDMGCEC